MASQRPCDGRRSSPASLNRAGSLRSPAYCKGGSKEQYSEELRRIKTESHTGALARQTHIHIHNSQFALEVEAVGSPTFLALARMNAYSYVSIHFNSVKLGYWVLLG